MKIVFAVTVIFGMLCTHKALAQFGMGLRAGGNLSGTNGSAFRSGKRIGFQIGGDLSYHFNKNIALQAEPVYNLM
ncbi:MAG: hypothetical protein ACN6PD_01355, partial [Sphingobacterium sp.]